MSETPRAALITGLILCLIIAVAFVALPFVQRFLPIFFTPFENQRIKTPNPNVFPAREEDAVSAAKPIAEVLDNLDFSNEEQAGTLFTAIVQSRLRREAFEELEAYFERVRAQKARFPGGGWKEFRFCGVLATCYGEKENPEKAWRDHFGRLERWMAQYPKSGIAFAVTAEAWTYYAWEARGEGYADTVSEEGWRLFRGRLQRGRQILESSQGVHTPMWFHTMQTIAMGQNWDREKYEKLFKEAINFEPLFFGVYNQKAYHLLPRWHGQEGEWQAFAMESADRIGGDEGDALYYFIASYMWDFYRNHDFFTVHGVSWPRMKRGFAATEKLYGLSWWRLNSFCSIAGQAMDREEARRLFDRIGDNWDMCVWKKQTTVDDFRDWLNQEGKYRKHN